MRDLVCLLADKSMEAAIDGLLRRPEALGIRAIEFETIVHPRRDPGCFHEAGELLAGYPNRACRALVVLDREWSGSPAAAGSALEKLLEARLDAILPPEWARAVVIDPELEAWVFSDSPHVAAQLGWPTAMADLRTALQTQGLWVATDAKPENPKAALDWLLRRVGRPRSSSLFRALAEQVSLQRCQDRAFLRLMELLRTWFPQAQRDT